MDGLGDLLESSGHSGLPALRERLRMLLGGRDVAPRLVAQQRLKSGVYRLRLEANGRVRAFVVKALEPDRAERNRRVAERWLPAVGLQDSGPPLRGVAAEPGARRVWHVYDDLGDQVLRTRPCDRARVTLVVELLAQIHARFAGHRLLPECRRYGADLGAGFYRSSVHGAIRALAALPPPPRDPQPEWVALRDRLLARMHGLADEQLRRTRAISDLGGPSTLLHGDLWPSNALLVPGGNGLVARLIDWDHAGVGSISYDLSTLLARFPAGDRGWILGLYEAHSGALGWRLPPSPVLNLLFETAEYARLANCVLWATRAVADGHERWGYGELASIEQWLDDLTPSLIA